MLIALSHLRSSHSKINSKLVRTFRMLIVEHHVFILVDVLGSKIERHLFFVLFSHIPNHVLLHLLVKFLDLLLLL